MVVLSTIEGKAISGWRGEVAGEAERVADRPDLEEGDARFVPDLVPEEGSFVRVEEVPDCGEEVAGNCAFAGGDALTRLRRTPR